MNPNEQRSNNVIKGGYFNVSTKPAEPIVDSISNWGTISTAVINPGSQRRDHGHENQNSERQTAHIGQ
jgi:hypothetical protein